MIVNDIEILLVIVAVQAVNTVVFVWSRRSLLASNLVLRQQLTVLKRKYPRPALRDGDRLFWSFLSRVWKDWRSMLVIVKPDTVIRLQKKRFRDYWRRKSRPGPGRPPIEQQPTEFIRRISGDHPEYGEDKIALELEFKFGIQHSEATIRKYMVKAHGPRQPSQHWRTFLKNQADAIWTGDFYVQYTVRFTALYIFVIVELGSRRIVHINVAAYPNLAWVRQQIRDATFGDQPKFLIHDNDGIFG